MSTHPATRTTTALDLEHGQGLAFLLGAFRSGTTLLRKVLDGHSQIYSPAETWFLLPLLNVWEGQGETASFLPRQAAAAVRSHLDADQFAECCRAFAGRFYAARLPDGARWFVDKTPPYLAIADRLPAVFPDARYLVLVRDPRSILWSRATWKHTSSRDPRAHLPGVVEDIKRLASFVNANAGRSSIVRYESLCTTPADEITAVCDFLGLQFEPGMTDYGGQAHHEGYGDETTREFKSPHRDALRRWAAADGLDSAIQAELVEACGRENLHALRLGTLEPDSTARGETAETARDVPPAPLPSAAPLPVKIDVDVDLVTGPPVGRSATRRGRVMFFMHPGTNSRSIFLDMTHGFRKAGYDVLYWELGPVWQWHERAGAQRAEALRASANIIRHLITSNGVDLSVSMWANSIFSMSSDTRDGKVLNYFDVIEEPHLMFWLDAPHWSQQNPISKYFNSPIVGGKYCFHLINNPATGAEMTDLMGFTNVLAHTYGINEEIFQPYDVEQKYDIVFGLGPGDAPPTDLMRRELESDDPDHDAIRAEAAANVRKSFYDLLEVFDPGHRDGVRLVCEGLLQIQLKARHLPMLARLRSLAAHHDEIKQFCDMLMANTGAYLEVTAAIRSLDNWERAFILTYLSRRFNTAVFGKPTLDGWDCRAEYLGELKYEDQAKAYSSARIGLNVMRWQDDIGVNVKPYEITASGAACLMGRRELVANWLEPDKEIVLFDSPGEARRQAEALLSDEHRRRAIAEAGMARTRRDHTWTVRAREIMDVISAKTARGPAQ